MTTPRELQALYQQGRNITQLLRGEQGLPRNTAEIIEVAYDLQTGSYIAAMQDAAMAEHKRAYASELARMILSLCEPASILEAGVGEATTLAGVLPGLGPEVASHGFDLSWSRVAYAQRWLRSQGSDATTLCTGNLFHIPYADDSIDVVYTSHSIEPNGGSERPILQELHRVARKYLILLEPGYELASDEARQRMERHGYCRNLKGIAEDLGCRVLKHELFAHTASALNPTAITVIEKRVEGAPPASPLACPKFKTPLERIGDMLFSPEALAVYPIVGGIPCLRIENAIFASKYAEVVGARR